MSRIRSVHPGLFTDEAFVTLGPAAQVFWIGLWCEADDQGVFEWKPLTLKMRLLPASPQMVEPLLEELVTAGCIRRYDVDGRWFGVVRNFARHQRPKSPKDIHPLPEELRNYAGFNGDGSRPDATTGRKRYGSGSEPVPNSFRTTSEIGSQMEDEGEGVGKKGSAASVPNGTTAAVAKATAPPSVDLAETDPEQWFWDRAAELERRGCVRSQFGALVQLHGSKWTSLVPTIKRVMAAREPSGFLNKLVVDLRRDRAATSSAPPSAPTRRTQRGGEPDFVRSARAEGQTVKVIQRRNGEPGYRIGTETFDAAGREIGF